MYGRIRPVDAIIDQRATQAIQGGNSFMFAQEQVRDWLLTQHNLLDLPFASVPVPSRQEWGELSAGNYAQLPTPELIFSNLAKQKRFQGKSSDELLRVMWGMAVTALDPTQDPKYVRSTMDRGNGLPEIMFGRIKDSRQRLGVGQVSVGYILFDERKRVGRVAITSMDCKKSKEQQPVREAWFSSLRFIPGVDANMYRLSAHISGAEHADAQGRAFRTPIEAAAEPTLHPRTAAVWQQFIAKGVAQEVMPLEPMDGKYKGHVFIPARVWRG